MATRKIEVKQSHIKRGLRKQCYRCPIALALKDAGFVGAGVESDHWDWSGSGGTHPLPKKAIQFVERFDVGKPVKPFSFIVRGGA